MSDDLFHEMMVALRGALICLKNRDQNVFESRIVGVLRTVIAKAENSEIEKDGPAKRWLVEVTYRSRVHDNVIVRHEIEEIEELQEIIEMGPDWACINNVKIELARNLILGKCLEDAQ